MEELIYIILGIVGLLGGTELVIRGAVNIAKSFKLSRIFIGVTILAIGTDLSEMVLAITGAIHKLQGQNTSDIIIGNALGSCFGQMGLVMGIIGIFGHLKISKTSLIRDGSGLVGSLLLFLLVSLDGEISRLEGSLLLIAYIVYYAILIKSENLAEKIEEREKKNHWLNILMLIGGLVLVGFSSDFIINNAEALAKEFNIASSFIGIVIIGIGTSLPELAISINALRKKESSLSVGNIIGSNVFDMLIPIGIGSAIAKFDVSQTTLIQDLAPLSVLTISAILFFTHKKKLHKAQAAVLLLIYLVYIGWKILEQNEFTKQL